MKELIAVIGAGECTSEIYDQAYELGKLLGDDGFTVVCGGLGGVMEAVSKGVKSTNGLTIGILPGNETSEANNYIDIGIATGMGIGRNIILIRSALAIIAVNGKYGTLSELAFALQLKKPVIGLNTWDVSDGIIKVASAKEAVLKVKEILNNV